jgi:fucose permease
MDTIDVRHPRGPVLVANVLFILIGISAGVGGVLLAAQIRDYRVDPATIGLMFFTGSVGFAVGSGTAGSAIHRFGTRAVLIGGAAMFVAAALYTATRPAFAVFVLVQLFSGGAGGLIESVLSAYLSGRPNATTLLNRMHAFFGVGALIGPLLAAWMLTFTTWPRVSLVLAAAGAPFMLAGWITYPRRGADPLAAVRVPEPSGEAPDRTALMPTVIRQRAVLFAAALLSVYVGLEISVGNWAYNYLLEGRSFSGLLAGYIVSGYWLGLTLGRFLISPIAARIRLTQTGVMYACLVGVTVTALLTWAPIPGVSSAGFVLLGFFLGPIFPSTIAIAPRLVASRLVPTAMGVMTAGSVVGGAALPWLAGIAAQDMGVWTLLPYAAVLGLVQLAIWQRIAVRIDAPVAGPVAEDQRVGVEVRPSR